MKQLPDEIGTLRPAVDVPVKLRSTFGTTSLFIRASLAGSAHRFTFNQHRTEICLPDPLPRKAVGDPGTKETADLWCYSWRSKRKTPLAYEIARVRVVVDLNRTLTIPQAALGKVSPKHHTKPAFKALEDVVRSGEKTAEDAFRLWVRTLRWKSLNARINQMNIEPTDVARGSRLVDASTGQAFYAPPIMLSAGVTAPITRRIWNSCGKALRTHRTPPLWLDFLFEGEHRVTSSDLHGGIVCLAIACELLMRRVVMRPTNRRFFPLLKKMEIGRIREQWANLGPTSKRLSAAFDTERLKRLFDLRNGIMHRGEIRALNQSECRELAKMARSFIVAGTTLAERVPAP
jgi:hypothetical protein